MAENEVVWDTISLSASESFPSNQGSDAGMEVECSETNGESLQAVFGMDTVNSGNKAVDGVSSDQLMDKKPADVEDEDLSNVLSTDDLMIPTDEREKSPDEHPADSVIVPSRHLMEESTDGVEQRKESMETFVHENKSPVPLEETDIETLHSEKETASSTAEETGEATVTAPIKNISQSDIIAQPTTAAEITVTSTEHPVSKEETESPTNDETTTCDGDDGSELAVGESSKRKHGGEDGMGTVADTGHQRKPDQEPLRKKRKAKVCNRMI
jgi:hypothetical protein